MGARVWERQPAAIGNQAEKRKRTANAEIESTSFKGARVWVRQPAASTLKIE